MKPTSLEEKKILNHRIGVIQSTFCHVWICFISDWEVIWLLTNTK